jgi:hypothetical protein
MVGDDGDKASVILLSEAVGARGGKEGWLREGGERKIS